VAVASLLAAAAAADRAGPTEVTTAAVRVVGDVLVPHPTGSGWLTADGAAPPGASVCRAAGGPALLRLAWPAGATSPVRVGVWTAPGGEESAGLVFRWRDARHYYLARLNTRTNGLRLVRYEAGQPTLLAGRDVPIPVGQWHVLAVDRRDGQVQVALDGEAVLEGEDAPWQDDGLGLWVGRATHACFTEVRLAALDAPSRAAGGGDPPATR
jgi:hypothetical protein